MTKEQFDRWRDFAIRMAEHGYPRATERRRDKILEEVKDYFGEREFQQDWPTIDDWDHNEEFGSVDDDVIEYFDRYRHWQRDIGTYDGGFYNQVSCCIRAGFDMAVKQSGGVLGFTAGDVRRMYNGAVPDWIAGQDWDMPFERIPDDAPVWL
jgi:hypothetical protein